MSDLIHKPRPEVGGREDALPMAALLGLAASGFLCIVTETLPAGLLPQIAAGLQVSESLAGQLVATYALGSLIAAIPLTSLTEGFGRRQVLLATILCFLVGNTITAVAGSFALALAARFVSGCAAGLAWGILAGYARSISPPTRTGKAMAVAMVGVPLALSLGVPVGTLLGHWIGWRGAFAMLSGTSLILVAWIVLKVPDVPGRTAGAKIGLGQVFRTPGVRPILVVILFWMIGHNILYTYVAPLARHAGARIDVALAAFGIAAIAGIWIVARLIDQSLRALVLLAIGSTATVAVILAAGAGHSSLFYAASVLWGVGFGGAGALMQTASADVAGDGVDIAQAMVTTAWNVAIAAGGAMGGVLLDWAGVRSIAPVVALFSIIALGVAVSARRYAFPPGAHAKSIIADE